MFSVAIAVCLVVAVCAASLSECGHIKLHAALLGAYGAAVPIGAAATLPGLPAPYDTLSSVLGLAAGANAVWIVWRLGAERRVDSAPEVVLWIALAVWICISWYWSIGPSQTYSAALQLVSFVVLAIAIVQVDYDADDIRVVETSLVVGLWFVGFVAIDQWNSGAIGANTVSGDRFGTVSNDPGLTAAALVLPMLVALGAVIDPRRRAVLRGLALGGFGLGAVALILTATRGGLIALVVGGVYLCIALGYRTSAMAGISVSIGLLAVVGLPAIDRVGAGSTGRTSIWSAMLAGCEARCIAGSGFGTSRQVHASAVLANPHLGRDRLQVESHNLWVGALAEIGAIGLLILAMIFAAAISVAWSQRDLGGHVAVAAVGGLILTNLFLSSPDFKYFWLVLVFATLQRCRRGGQQVGPGGPLVRPVRGYDDGSSYGRCQI